MSSDILFSWHAEDGTSDYSTSLRRVFELFMQNSYPKYSSKLLREELLLETSKSVLILGHILGSCLKQD